MFGGSPGVCTTSFEAGTELNVTDTSLGSIQSDDGTTVCASTDPLGGDGASVYR